MLETILKIAFVLILFVLAYKLIFNSNKGLIIFEMHFKDGKLSSHKGKIPEKFKQECRALAKAKKLSMTVRCEKQGDVRLHVSANVGDNLVQQVRNLFPFEYYDRKTADNSKLSG
jgi:hypothetical protein